jgi:hypothetical protein
MATADGAPRPAFNGRSARTFFIIGTLAALVVGAALFGSECMSMPRRSHRGTLPALTNAQRELATVLEGDVTLLAGTIGERNVMRPAELAAAAKAIEQELARAGYAVQNETYPVLGCECANVWAEVRGSSRADEIVIVGAHYDSVLGSPGANDNASGVAAMLALARRFARSRHERTLRVVAFVNEEPPWFQTESMGSLVHARGCTQRAEKIVAMYSLETLGCYSDAERSQHYPLPALSWIYPSRGNFVAFVGIVASRALVKSSIASFRRAVAFPSEGAALPGFVPGVGWSDHWSFWEQGCPAVMVTDTAPFRYPEYHTHRDTPEKVDCDRLARVVEGLAAVIEAQLGSSLEVR